MINHQVEEVEINEAGDLFIGVYSDFLAGAGGIYKLYHNSTKIDTCIYGPEVNGLALNSAGHIFAGTGWPDGIIVSRDSGITFEYVNSGLPAFPMGTIEVDNQDYVYALVNMPSHFLYRSSQPTITSLNELMQKKETSSLQILPNPASKIISCCTFSKENLNMRCSISIVDIGFHHILNQMLDIIDGRFQVDVSSLKPGLYIVSLQVDDQLLTSKLIIK